MGQAGQGRPPLNSTRVNREVAVGHLARDDAPKRSRPPREPTGRANWTGDVGIMIAAPGVPSPIPLWIDETNTSFPGPQHPPLAAAGKLTKP